MKKGLILGVSLLFAILQGNIAQIQKDVIKTRDGDLEIWFIGHGSLMFNYHGKSVIHVDPYSNVGDYSSLPKADIILITHEHSDHLDVKAIDLIRNKNTRFVTNCGAGKTISDAMVMKNNETITLDGLTIESVPAYNIIHKREDGAPFHPKAMGNGYIITFANIRVYVAGDTENIPEMANLKKIDVAFLPMNLPYTMTPEMCTEAAKMVMPKILYPYHFGETDTNKLVELLKEEKGIEVRIRKMN